MRPYRLPNYNKRGKTAGNPYNYNKFIAHSEILVSRPGLISALVTTSSLAPVGEGLVWRQVI